MWDNRIRNWYVYAHYKEDSDELFYIGIKSNAHIMDCLYGKRNTIFG